MGFNSVFKGLIQLGGTYNCSFFWNMVLRQGIFISGRFGQRIGSLGHFDA